MVSKCNNCDTCKFWIPITKSIGDERKQGECKLDGPAMGPNGFGYWPVTFGHYGCFKWEPVEPEVLNG